MDNESQKRKRVPQVLLVSDDVELRWSFGQLLAHSGYDVTHCLSSSSLIYQIAFNEPAASAARFDVLICDARLLNDPAIKMLQRWHKQRQRPPLVLLHHTDHKVGAALSVRLQPSAVCGRFDLADQLAIVRQIAPVNGLRRRSLRERP